MQLHDLRLSISLPLALALAAATPALAAESVTLTADLSGANEVDAQGVGNHGAPGGTGSFTGRFADGQLCYTLASSGIDTPTMAHIHSGAAGKNGGVAVPLTELGAGEHCSAVDKDKAAAIIAQPGDYYVNIHNAAFPAGAVRGQLVKK